MTARVYIGLLHYPVLDKDGRVITTAVTNLDLHDLARLRRTYGLAGYYVIQPLEMQARLVKRLTSYWTEGPGGDYNLTRKQAFETLELAPDLDAVMDRIGKREGQGPSVVMTSARPMEDHSTFREIRAMIGDGGVWLILFGTGWGVTDDFIREKGDYTLEPIDPGAGYNHLSVRTAAAIILDRILGHY